jgi:hypothetical protein
MVRGDGDDDDDDDDDDYHLQRGIAEQRRLLHVRSAIERHRRKSAKLTNAVSAGIRVTDLRDAESTVAAATAARSSELLGDPSDGRGARLRDSRRDEVCHRKLDGVSAHSVQDILLASWVALVLFIWAALRICDLFFSAAADLA